MNLTAIFEPAAEGGYVCWVQEMPGVQSQGETIEEARANLEDAFKLSMEYLSERARELARPDAIRESFEPGFA